MQDSRAPFNRDHSTDASQEYRPFYRQQDFNQFELKGNERFAERQEDFYLGDYEDSYRQSYNTARDRPIQRYNPNARPGYEPRGPVSQGTEPVFDDSSRGNDIQKIDSAGPAFDDGRELPIEAKKEVLPDERMKGLEATEKKETNDSKLDMNNDRRQDADIKNDKLFGEDKVVGEQRDSAIQNQFDSKGIIPEEARDRDMHHDGMRPPERDEYWQRDRYPQEGRYPDDRSNQFDNRYNEWDRPQDRNRSYGNQGYPPEIGRRQEVEGYLGGSGFPRAPMRDEFGRLPVRDELERPPLRDEPSRYPLNSDQRDYPPRDYSARPPLRNDESRFEELGRPASPPRRESFREQIKFERRYRDWDREHFPIDDPTREWEFELRRRELLGAIPPAAGYAGGNPPRDYAPYEREGKLNV